MLMLASSSDANLPNRLNRIRHDFPENPLVLSEGIKDGNGHFLMRCHWFLIPKIRRISTVTITQKGSYFLGNPEGRRLSVYSMLRCGKRAKIQGKRRSASRPLPLPFIYSLVPWAGSQRCCAGLGRRDPFQSGSIV